jgi:hypothetical protein
MAKFNALQLQHIQYLDYESRQLTLATHKPEAKEVRYHPGLDATHERSERQQPSDQETLTAKHPTGSKPLVH